MLTGKRASVLAVAIVLLGLALRVAPWGKNRFLEDEALYAYWGLQIATGADSMLDHEPVDKPPLHPYTLALSLTLLGHNESAARLPSLIASVTSIALVYALARSLPAPRGTGDAGNAWAALLAALLLALSPFEILFASTAFTDPMMGAFALGALLAMTRGRFGAAGLLAGLAAATKQQGLAFLPLVVALGLGQDSTSDRRPHRWASFVAGLAVVIGAVVAWDLARAQRPGFFEQGLINYGGLALARPEEWGERAAGWLRLMGFFWASPWLTAGLAGALTLGFGGCLLARAIPRPGVADLALLAFAGAFLLTHWLIAFRVWDRYLLGLVPLVALLAARAILSLAQAIRPQRRRLGYAVAVSALITVLLSRPALLAARSELPVGGDHGAYDGIDDLAAYAREQVPEGAVLYDYWLGYHYRFYLYGAPIRHHWYPDLVDLVEDATAYRREPRYIAFPSWRASAPAEAALESAGIRLVPVLATTRRSGSVSFRLYRLEGP